LTVGSALQNWQAGLETYVTKIVLSVFLYSTVSSFIKQLLFGIKTKNITHELLISKLYIVTLRLVTSESQRLNYAS